MKHINIKSLILIMGFMGVLLITSCSASNGTDDLMDASANASSTETAQAPSIDIQVPSPGEMLQFIKMLGGKSNKNTGFLNPASNLNAYNEASQKALNFGIYSCDLSYCSVFEIGSETLKYFKSVKQLGDQMGLSSAISNEQLKRLEQNVSKSDSLSVITDDIYFSSFSALENSKQGPTIALIMAGGWIESMHIACNLVQFKPNSPASERIADQKYALENIIDYMKKYEGNAMIDNTRKDLENLYRAFQKIKEQDLATVKSNSETTVLGGTQQKQLIMSETNFKEIAAEVASLRDKYTHIN